MNVQKLVLTVLCTMTGAFVFSNAPALAATNNAYQSQFKPAFTSGGLAVSSSGEVYLVDAEHQVVYEFGPSGTGTPLAEFKASATSEKSFDTETNGNIAVNSSGDLYVIGASHTVVDEFNPNGTALLAEFNGNKTAGEYFYAEGIAVNTKGDVYVADLAQEVVDEFSPPATGKSEPIPLGEFNGLKTAGGSFSPRAIAVNASGDV